MGRDKAALPFGGEALWQHQLGTLRATEAAELFISGPADGPYANAGIPVLPDESPGLGPLGGLATALRRCSSEWLLVLAVDMPGMTPEFLRTLVDESERTAAGIVPCVAKLVGLGAGISPSSGAAEGRTLEPLAAVYPRAALALADECLRSGKRKLEVFVHALEAQGLVSIRPFEAAMSGLFTNWNMPGDFGSLSIVR